MISLKLDAWLNSQHHLNGKLLFHHDFFCIGPAVRFLPHVKANVLQPEHLAKMPSNPLSDQTVTELLKTGNVLAQQPWNLLKAEHWLTELCARNQERRFLEPVPLRFYFEPDENLLPLEQLPADGMAPIEEPPAPRHVRVFRHRKKAMMRRPAAAAAPGHDVEMLHPPAVSAEPGRFFSTRFISFDVFIAIFDALQHLFEYCTSSSRASRGRKFQKKKELYSKETLCL